MTNIKDTIKDDEIRIIGNTGQLSRPQNKNGKNPKKRRIIIICAVICAIICVIGVFFFLPKEKESLEEECSESFFEPNNSVQVIRGKETLYLGTYPDSLSIGYTETIDTVINDIPLKIHIPHNAIPSLHVGRLNEKDTNIVLAAQAADIRRDNLKIVGAFVLKGKPLAWGKAKTGFCAIINDTLTIGIAENSPLFEKATENEGYFFRQYPLVDNGKLVENAPKNKAIRRSLCDRNGEIMLIESLSKESFHDFAQALEDLEVTNAIYFVGSTSYGWSIDSEGNRSTFGKNNHRLPDNINYILWHKK